MEKNKQKLRANFNGKETNMRKIKDEHSYKIGVRPPNISEANTWGWSLRIEPLTSKMNTVLNHFYFFKSFISNNFLISNSWEEIYFISTSGRTTGISLPVTLSLHILFWWWKSFLLTYRYWRFRTASSNDDPKEQVPNSKLKSKLNSILSERKGLPRDAGS